VRNAVVMHSYGLSTNGGYTLWMGANANANGGFGSYGHVWPIQSAAAEAEQNSRLTREAIDWVTHNPGEWLELVPPKFEHLMAWEPGPISDSLLEQRGDDPARGLYPRTVSGHEKALLGDSLRYVNWFRAWHYIYWSLGGLALILATWRRRRTGASLALLLVSFWILFHVLLVHGEARYMLSVTPLVAPALAWLPIASCRSVVARGRNWRARRGMQEDWEAWSLWLLSSGEMDTSIHSPGADNQSGEPGS